VESVLTNEQKALLDYIKKAKAYKYRDDVLLDKAGMDQT